MAEGRPPLAPRSLNAPMTALYPIFLGKRTVDAEGEADKPKRARPSPESRREKRPRPSLPEDDALSIPHFFAPFVPRRTVVPPKPPIPPPALAPEATGWKRVRRRLGAPPPRLSCGSPFLSSLASTTPSSIVLPSLNSPDGQHRDFDPVLAIAFSNKAKVLGAHDARQMCERRMLALGGEEGTVKIVDVDNAEAPSVWWRAHSNAVFDVKWAANDSWLLTASADQTLRIHDVSRERPHPLATLRGHTSTIKATTFLDPSRGSGDASWNVIASGGRDGNIHIYDLRCQGVRLADHDASLRRSSRTRASTGPNGPADLEPVLTLRQPHNATSSRRVSDLRSVTRTITSLVALQSMPGILASGGTYDGVVKLWDIRCPDPSSSLRPKSIPYGVLPDPTLFGPNASGRSRSVNALCEQPLNGDLYALCGDSKIHVLRPSAALYGNSNPRDAILPQKFVHPDLLVKSFYVRMAISPDGKHLASGSREGGVMTWATDTAQSSDVTATPLRIPSHGMSEMPEVTAVDWAKDMVAAASDDSVTRLWNGDKLE